MASMGPRSHSADLLGASRRPRANSSRFNGAAESLRGSTLVLWDLRQEGYDASMGPRSHSADLHMRPWSHHSFMSRLQWGRGVTPRIYEDRPDERPNPRGLQWGRGVTPRIYRGRDLNRLKKLYELQWGRGVTPRIYALRKSGSTRRRLLLQWGRGVTPRIYPIPEVFVQVLIASMGPRSHSADLRWICGLHPPGLVRFNGAAESLRGSTPHPVS